MAQTPTQKNGAFFTQRSQSQPPTEPVPQNLAMDDTLRFATSYEPVEPKKLTNVAPISPDSSVSSAVQPATSLHQEAATTSLSVPVYQALYQPESPPVPRKTSVQSAVRRTIFPDAHSAKNGEISDLERLLNRKKQSN